MKQMIEIVDVVGREILDSRGNPTVEVEVYLDESLKRFQTVFPACGSSNSMIELTPAELEEYSKPESWVDVCKPMA